MTALRSVAEAMAGVAGSVVGVSVADVLGRSRSRTAVVARHAVWCAMRARGHSYPEIGRATGHDHSTVLAAVRAHPAPGTQLERLAWAALDLRAEGELRA